MEEVTNTEAGLSEGAFNFLKELWDDRGNWAGNPVLDGNVNMSNERKGYLTDLKKKGYLTTTFSDGCTWVEFNDKCVELFGEAI